MNEWDDFSEERPKHRNDNQNTIDLLNKLLRNWYWFIIFGILAIALSWLFLRYSTPIYRIHAKVLVIDEKKGGSMGSGELLGDLGSLIGGKSNVDNEVEVLLTRDLLQLVVEKLQAHITFYSKGRVRQVELLEAPYNIILHAHQDSIQNTSFSIKRLDAHRLQLKAKGWEKELTIDKSTVIPGLGQVTIMRNNINPSFEETIEVEIVSISDKTAELLSSLKVSVTNKQTSTIDLTTEHALAQKGVQILHTLLNTYTTRILEDKNKVADSTMAFINTRLHYVSQDLGSTEDQIKSFKQKKGLTDIGAQSQILLDNSSSYAKELAQTEGQLLMLEEMERYLSDQKQVRVLPNTSSSQDPIFSKLVERYNSLLLDRERLLMTHTEDNPYVQNLDQQIQSLRVDMRSSIQSSRRQLNIIQQGQQRRVVHLEGEIRKVPSTERNYIDLSRQQQIKQELYIFLQQKWEETAIGKTANISNVKVIDAPRADKMPVSPKRSSTMIMGLLLGLAFPFAIIYIRGLFNVRIRNKEDIKTRTDAPILGIIGHGDLDQPVVVSENARSPVAEQFRTLRTNISFMNATKDKLSILTTSSMSGEGKSFVALNLALSLALTGKKVVLLELDLRKPALASKMGIVQPLGFSNFVIDPKLNLSDIVLATEHKNLQFVSAGTIPPNPAELIIHPRSSIFFMQIKAEFDVVIIDTAPVGLVTDAQLLSPYADSTLYIVRQDVTFKKQLEIPQDLIRNKKIDKLSIVLNDAKAGNAYGYQGYGYGYGYYNNDAPKAKWWQFWLKA